MSRERRCASRVALEIPASVFVGSDRLPCRLLNVSTTGIGLASTFRRPPGAWVRVLFQLPGQAETIDADALLVRSAERGPEVEWGIKFVNLGSEVTAQLQEYVGCVLPIHPGADPGAQAPSETVSEWAAEQERERLHKLRLQALYRQALDELNP